MLSFVGLGLWNECDITLKGLAEVKKCDKVYAEFYTSAMGTDIERLEKTFGKKVIILTREEVENGEHILNEAETHHVCLLTGGDSMAATTHVDLRIRAEERRIPTLVVHGVSIISAAAGMLGLQIYKFGRTVSIIRPSEHFFPLSPYDAIEDNLSMRLHSLLLLDTAPECMSANEAMKLLGAMEKQRQHDIVTDSTIVAVVARASSPDALAKAGFFADMKTADFGPPPHAVVIPTKMHIMEANALVTLAGAPKALLKSC